MTWQPIETAPLDGRVVLLYLPAPWGEIRMAHWFAPWQNWQEGDSPDSIYHEYGGIGSGLPTHWMDLPVPPA